MRPEVDVLVVGTPPKCAMIAACRSEQTKELVDSAILPSDLEIQSDFDDDRPEHPMVLIRCFSSVEMIFSPMRLRAMANWMNQAADWLEDSIQE